MNQLKFILLWTSMLTMSMSNCSEGQDEMSPQNSKIENCFTGEIIKSVKDQKGTIYYDTNEMQYALYVEIPGAFDSQDVGFICDKLDTLKKSGLVVTFNGNYFPYKKDLVAPIGGLKYYFLDITDFKISKE